MASQVDLGPAANQVAALVKNTSDEQMSAPTPCPAYTVGDLLDHFVGLTQEFTNAAAKRTRRKGSNGTQADAGSGAPQPSAANLQPEWRTQLAWQLDELADAWRDPAAWKGMTTAGGVTLPAEVMGLVALDELVLHGWDLARGTGQQFECDPASTEAVFQFTQQSAAPGEEAGREGVFGPVVPVPETAPLFDRALGFSGRDPAWGR